MKERTVGMADFYRMSDAEGASPGLVFLSNESLKREIRLRYVAAENAQQIVNKLANSGALDVNGSLFKMHLTAIGDLPFIGLIQ